MQLPKSFCLLEFTNYLYLNSLADVLGCVKIQSVKQFIYSKYNYRTNAFKGVETAHPHADGATYQLAKEVHWGKAVPGRTCAAGGAPRGGVYRWPKDVAERHPL